MKSSIKVSRGGRSIALSGDAARSAFEALSGTKLPPPEPALSPIAIVGYCACGAAMMAGADECPGCGKELA